MIKFDNSKTLLSQILREVTERESYPLGAWKNKPVQLNDKFAISVQAGEYYYCNPKGNFKLNSDYIEYEVGLMSHTQTGWALFQPRNIFAQFYWADLFEHGDNPVAGYLTASEIEDIVRDILRVSPLIHFI